MTYSILTSITLAGAYSTAMETAKDHDRRHEGRAVCPPRVSALRQIGTWLTSRTRYKPLMQS